MLRSLAKDFACSSEGIESLRVIKDADLLVLLRVVARTSLLVTLWWLMLLIRRPVVGTC